MAVPTHLYILLSVLVLAQIVTSALAAYLWARVSSAPTHGDLTALREDIEYVRNGVAGVNERINNLSERSASQGATLIQTHKMVELIQSYLLEHKP